MTKKKKREYRQTRVEASTIHYFCGSRGHFWIIESTLIESDGDGCGKIGGLGSPLVSSLFLFPVVQPSNQRLTPITALTGYTDAGVMLTSIQGRLVIAAVIISDGGSEKARQVGHAAAIVKRRRTDKK